MVMTTQDKLEKFGLSDKEAKIYLSLLGLGPSSVSEIAKNANLNRSTAYVLLESLIKLDLVAVSEKNKISIYSPASPDRLVIMAEDKARSYNEKIILAKSLSEELKPITDHKHKFKKAILLDGLDGLKTAYDGVLDAKGTIRTLLSSQNASDLLPDYLAEYYNKLDKKKVPIEVIVPEKSESGALFKKKITNKGSLIIKNVPVGKEGFSSEINVYDNKIAFISPSEKFALVIESDSLAETMKRVFSLIINKTKENKHS